MGCRQALASKKDRDGWEQCLSINSTMNEVDLIQQDFEGFYSNPLTEKTKLAVPSRKTRRTEEEEEKTQLSLIVELTS